MADSDVDVVVKDPDPVEVKLDGALDAASGPAPSAPAEPAKTISAEEALETLKAQHEAQTQELAREKAARANAEANARQEAERALAARTQSQSHEVDMVSSALETVKQQQVLLQNEYAAAMQAQDFSRVAELQSQMGETAAKKVALESGLENLKARPKPEAPRIAPINDPVEQLAVQLSPRSANWVRQHPQFATDQTKFQAMLGAHNLVTSKGIQPDTDEYFRQVEHLLDIAPQNEGRANGGVQVHVDPMAQSARPMAPAAAPVGGASGGGNGSARTVRLTADEIEMARMMDISPEEYARNKLNLKKEGRLN